ncbi:MAG: ABC transporter ATP-binding protein, partial [Chloroflexi bacterium]|nr:ABC transporter ATP-binding protein [Chloroflexota bacterium]
SASRTLVPPHRRNTGMVFQSYAIWPHMSVYENVAFPLQHGARKYARAAVRDKVMHALELVQLAELAERPAPMLSGGQQQRVALARAVASEPSLLLLDEPLSNLDARLREDMRHEIKALAQRLAITTVYVTHDQLEALSMSDRLALINEGRIVQEGPPRDVYLHPADAFAANFLGRTNLLDAQVVGPDLVETRWGRLTCSLPGTLALGAQVTVGFRPESAELADTGDGLVGTVVSTTFVGEAQEYQVDLGGQTVRVKAAPFRTRAEGERVVLRIPAERCHVVYPTGSPRAA